MVKVKDLLIPIVRLVNEFRENSEEFVMKVVRLFVSIWIPGKHVWNVRGSNFEFKLRKFIQSFTEQGECI